MRVALVENTAITHHGQVGVALAEAGAIIDIFRPFADGRLPAPGEHDALVVFGGEQSARDDARHPYLPALAALMAETAETGRAVLGLCLGAQLLARGLPESANGTRLLFPPDVVSHARASAPARVAVETPTPPNGRRQGYSRDRRQMFIGMRQGP